MQADPVLQSQCLSILKDIKNHPLSFWFREPFSADKLTMDDYLSMISRPMDLSTIQNNLENNVYPNFECFASDMDLIFENAITYNGADSLVGGIGLYLRGVVKKRINEIRYQNPRNYEARLFELIRSVDSVLANPPQGNGIPAAKGSDLSSIGEFSSVRIEQLVRALNTLANDGKAPQILDVLRSADEGFGAKERQQGDIDLALVSRRALLALDDFVKRTAK